MAKIGKLRKRKELLIQPLVMDDVLLGAIRDAGVTDAELKSIVVDPVFRGRRAALTLRWRVSLGQLLEGFKIRLFPKKG